MYWSDVERLHVFSPTSSPIHTWSVSVKGRGKG